MVSARAGGGPGAGRRLVARATVAAAAAALVVGCAAAGLVAHEPARVVPDPQGEPAAWDGTLEIVVHAGGTSDRPDYRVTVEPDGVLAVDVEGDDGRVELRRERLDAWTLGQLAGAVRRLPLPPAHDVVNTELTDLQTWDFAVVVDGTRHAFSFEGALHAVTSDRSGAAARWVEVFAWVVDRVPRSIESRTGEQLLELTAEVLGASGGAR